MNLKINKEAVISPETVCRCVQEQAVELDFVLPDYYPEIFRIVKCFAETEITSSAVTGDRLSYELTVKLCILYCPEGSSSPEAVEQRLTYNRTVTLDRETDSPSAVITASPDRFTCRAVNKRRIDIRGAVTVKIDVSGETKTELISDCFGGSIQLKKVPLRCPSSIVRVSKRASVSDEFDIPEDSPSVGTVLRAEAQIVSADKKLIAGKAAAKGELKISMLYSPNDPNADSTVCTLQFSLPFSVLIDTEGVDEGYDCRVTSQVLSCSIKPRSEGDGASRSVECEVMLLAECTAVRMSVFEVACDEYSTALASSHTSVPVKLRQEPVSAEGSVIIKGTCENRDSPLSEIYDAWCRTDKMYAEASDGVIKASGNALLCIFGKAENGDFAVCETEVPVEEVLVTGGEKGFSGDSELCISFSVVSCTYTISSESKADVKAEIAVRGYAADCRTVNVLTDIQADEASPREKNGDYALKLYFAEKDEELWDIAKECGASAQAIMDENDLDTPVLSESRMLLIPF